MEYVEVGHYNINTEKSTGPKADPCGTPYLTVPPEEQEPRIKTNCTLFLRYEQKRAMRSNRLNRQKALRGRFFDQQDRTLFLSPQKTSPHRSDLFIAESLESVIRPSVVLQECLRRKPD